MINAERRGVIAGSEEARKQQGKLPQDHEIEQLASQTFDFMQRNGYGHIHPKSDFIPGFVQGFKFTIRSFPNKQPITQEGSVFGYSAFIVF